MKKIVETLKKLEIVNDLEVKKLKYIDLQTAEYYRGRRDAFKELAEALENFIKGIEN